MRKSALFISDLHLGRGDELEGFPTENEHAFARFLAEQSKRYQNEHVNLVILGDFLDVWQSVSDEDKHADNSSSIDIALDAASDRDKVFRIIQAHPKTFESLREYLKQDPGLRSVTLVIGNHDHSLVNEGVQEVLRDAIAGSENSLRNCIKYAHYYEDPELGVYAEHGNQYDANNDYDDFATFGQECPGYFFVRLFWNRMELLAPCIDTWWNSFQAITERKLWTLILPAYRLFRQYRTDPRRFKRIDVPGVPLFAAGTQPFEGPVSGKSLPGFPDVLFSNRGLPNSLFATDVAVENKFRTLYHDRANAEFRHAVDRILEEKYHGAPPAVPVDLVVLAPSYGLFSDEYVGAIAKLFAPAPPSSQLKPLMGSLLTKERYKYVLFGHTHEDKNTQLMNGNVTYFNTGSWSVKRSADGENLSRLCYVNIEQLSNGDVRAAQAYWSLH